MAINARRIARLEQRGVVAVPHVIEVASGETDEQAIGRFVDRHGRTPASCIIVPTRASNDQLADLEAIWAEQQRRLVADARTVTQKLKEEPDARRNRQRIISRNPGSRGLPPKHAVADAAKRDDRQP